MNPATLDRAAVEARPRLVAIAYRMLGSMSDAEDVVQDALIRAHRAAPTELDSPVAYLTTITTRVAIDHLRSARVRREAYVGPWLPEPVAGEPAGDASADAVLADSLSMAFLAVLETLSPDERAILLLHDVFGYTHGEAAAIVGRTEASSRQLLRRARQRIEADRPRYEADRQQRDELVRRFMAACEGGDMDAFLALLTDDATLVSDGGATVKAARHPIRGAVRTARLLAYLMARHRNARTFVPVPLNGQPALAVVESGRMTGAVFVDAGPDGRIARLHWVRNPAKLERLRPLVEVSSLSPAADHPAGGRAPSSPPSPSPTSRAARASR